MFTRRSGISSVRSWQLAACMAWCLAAFVVVEAACSKRAGPVESLARAPAATQAPSASSAAERPPSPSGEGASADVVSGLGLGAKLEMEARNRPLNTPKAEDVYGAFEKEGFALTEKRQHVASVFGANYCVGAKSEDDMAFSVCEFANEDAAKAGRKASLRSLGMVPNREIVLRKKSMLTVRQPSVKTKASEDASAKAVRIFANL